MAKKEIIIRGGKSALADLGFADAEEISAKIQLAVKANKLIEGRGLKQKAAAKVLGISQGNVSALVNYKLDAFSTERLMTFLNALGHDVEIRVKRKPAHRPAQVTVIAA